MLSVLKGDMVVWIDNRPYECEGHTKTRASKILLTNNRKRKSIQSRLKRRTWR